MPKPIAAIVDDNPWVLDLWRKKLCNFGSQLVAYTSGTDLLKNLHGIQSDTPIFLDERLGTEQSSGTVIMNSLVERGFHRVYLASALCMDTSPLPNGFIAKVGKEPPLWLRWRAILGHPGLERILAPFADKLPLSKAQRNQRFVKMTNSERAEFIDHINRLSEEFSGERSQISALDQLGGEEQIFTKLIAEDLIYLGISFEDLQQVLEIVVHEFLR